jgi:hypothetical protein
MTPECDVSSSESPVYLKPYLRAAARHKSGFGTLLWASPHTQAVRFEAIRQMFDLNGRTVLDVGCGRADLLDYLLSQGTRPMHYVGLEAVPDLVSSARKKNHPHSIIIEGDFVADPIRMFVGAEAVIFSGSLNTLDSAAFYNTIRTAFEATAEILIFNFLGSPLLAGQDYLHWHPQDDVRAFARSLASDVDFRDDYLPGDCTISIRKKEEI